MKTTNKNRFFYLLSFSGRYKYLSILGCILSAVAAICAMMPFYYIWKFVDAICLAFPNINNAQNLENYAIMALTFAILNLVIYFFALMSTHLSAFHNEKNMKQKAVDHIVKLPLGYFTKNSSGKLSKIIDYSTSKTEAFLAHMLPDLIGALITPIIFLIILFYVDWLLGLICLIPLLIAFSMFIPMFSSKSKNFMILYQRSLENMNAEAVEYIRGMPVTKTFQQTIFSYKNFYDSIKKYSKFVSNYTLSTQIPFTAFTVSINGFFALLIPVGILFTASVIDITFLSKLIFYIIFTPFAAVMLNKIMYVSQNWMIASDAIDKIDTILNEKPLDYTSNPQSPNNYDIEFNNVYFDYNNSQNHDDGTLKNINFKVYEGETVALVGSSGSGKSTIASLVPRFWDVNEGEITIGGVNIKNMSQEELMKNVSFVFQNIQLFKDTILNNVRMGDSSVSREKVLEVLEIAQCSDIIEKLKDGIDSEIGKKGLYLSGGEQQRIALARALLKDAPIVILDEATALADPENELKIQKSLSEITKGKTVLVIAHRLSTIQNVDRIIVINNGEIIEEGSHNELLELNGFYSSMWEEYNKSIQWKLVNEGDLND